MSALSLLHKYVSELEESAEQVIIQMGNSLIMEINYGVGKGISETDFLKIKRLVEIINNSSDDFDDYREFVKESLSRILAKYN